MLLRKIQAGRRVCVWADDHWKLRLSEKSGAPVVFLLSPKTHYDFTTLPKDRAAEMGQIMVALGAAIEALPGVARVHVSKWGDWGSRAHIIFIARPTRIPQFRGTMMAVWDDFLPPSRVRSGTRMLAPLLKISPGRTADTVSGAHPDLCDRAPSVAVRLRIHVHEWRNP